MMMQSVNDTVQCTAVGLCCRVGLYDPAEWTCIMHAEEWACIKLQSGLV